MWKDLVLGIYYKGYKNSPITLTTGWKRCIEERVWSLRALQLCTCPAWARSLCIAALRKFHLNPFGMLRSLHCVVWIGDNVRHWQLPQSLASVLLPPLLMGNGALSSSSHPALVFLLTSLCPEAIWGLQPLAICSSHERRNPEIPSVLEALCQETEEEEMYCTVSYFWEFCRPQSNLALSLGVCVTLNKLFHFP